MGACEFSNYYIGKGTPAEAFNQLSQEAEAEYGHQEGYSGQINSTELTRTIELPPRKKVTDMVQEIQESADKGDCICLELKRTALVNMKKRHPEVKGKRGIRAYIFAGLAPS